MFCFFSVPQTFSPLRVLSPCLGQFVIQFQPIHSPLCPLSGILSPQFILLRVPSNPIQMSVTNRSYPKSSAIIVGPSPLLALSMAIAALLLLFAGTSQPVQAVPVPMPFRRFFFLSAANPTMLDAETQPAVPPHSSRQNLAEAEERLLEVQPENDAEIVHHQKSSQHSSRAALRGRVPMGPFDQVFWHLLFGSFFQFLQWKRGGDFCGCNMGCFYHSVGQCASCCSLGL